MAQVQSTVGVRPSHSNENGRFAQRPSTNDAGLRGTLHSIHVSTQDAVVRFLHANRVTILQATLGLVFLWFGALKIFGVSPVEALIAATVPWIPAKFLIPLLGVWELAIGGLLLWGKAVRLMLLLFLAQMAGTFLVLVLQPQISFQNFNPFLLTTEGEFVVKNLVLVAAGLSIGGSLLIQDDAKRA